MFTLPFAVLALFSPEPIPMPKSIPYFDKYAHFGLFLLLSCSCYLFFSKRSPIFHQLPVLLLAISTEWIQELFLPLRDFSMADAAANLTGVLIGSALYFFFWRNHSHLTIEQNTETRLQSRTS
ncbi:MAG: hypothetical protein GQ569_10710 [Methylococcaceae bacterium]|nr:hypothetical protein [Methylococcaceae bacterium]